MCTAEMEDLLAVSKGLTGDHVILERYFIEQLPCTQTRDKMHNLKGSAMKSYGNIYERKLM